jgi:hypothetical protein
METEIYGLVEDLIVKRNNELKQINYSRANEIKETLDKINIKIEDTMRGTRWRLGLASTPINPPSSNLARKFSLLHPVILPQLGH